MKKLRFVIIACALLLLCACEADVTQEKTTTLDGTSNSSATKETTTLPQKIEHIAQKLENGMLDNLDEYSDDEKEQIKQAVENDGYTLEYNDDGSGTLSNEEGEWIVGAGWVKNEYTDGVPEIDFADVTMGLEDKDSKGNYYMFLLRKANFLEVENYVETLEQAGFDNVETKTVNQQGDAVVFEAENAQGKRIELGYSSLGFTLKIYKK